MQRDMTILSDELKHRIRESLWDVQPEKVIVFGSYARGAAAQDSDIDIIVVLDSEAVPSTYHERMMNRLLVRRALDSLNRDYALDVQVYTMPEWKQFQDSNSAFSKEIAGQGVEI